MGITGLRNESPALLPASRSWNSLAIIAAGDVSIQRRESLGKADTLRIGFFIPERRIVMIQYNGFYSLRIVRGDWASVKLQRLIGTPVHIMHIFRCIQGAQCA